MSNWVVYNIIKEYDIKKRSLIIKKFILVAEVIKYLK